MISVEMNKSPAEWADYIEWLFARSDLSAKGRQQVVTTIIEAALKEMDFTEVRPGIIPFMRGRINDKLKMIEDNCAAVRDAGDQAVLDLCGAIRAIMREDDESGNGKESGFAISHERHESGGIVERAAAEIEKGAA